MIAWEVGLYMLLANIITIYFGTEIWIKECWIFEEESTFWKTYYTQTQLNYSQLLNEPSGDCFSLQFKYPYINEEHFHNPKLCWVRYENSIN